MADRVSQVAVEVLKDGVTAKARVSQEAVEVLKDGAPAKARVSQVAVELLIAPVDNARISQEAVEVFEAGTSNARLSQDAVEVFRAVHASTAGLSQLAVEVFVQHLPLQTLPFISSVTAVYAPALVGDIAVPFIGSVTTVYPPTLTGAGTEVDVPFIHSHTRVYGVFSLFEDTVGVGPGNGGETFIVRLAPNGTSVTGTLVSSIGIGAGVITLTGDTGMPVDRAFEVTIDDEKLLVTPIGAHQYLMRHRGLGNTPPATHTAGADVVWGDTYEMAIVAAADIGHEFSADILDSGYTTYPGWLMAFDATQAYFGGDRYPMHVTELVGVFDADTGTGGSNRVDASQPNAICTPTGASDDCPAALSNPARISTDIAIGDVGVVRYTNPEASVLDLGPRSVSLQSWFGLKRVDDTDNDVTFTDPTGHVVDTDPGVGDFTGSVNGLWFDPLGPGIAPDTGLPTSHDVPYTSVTLPGSDRYFTYGSPHYNETGWPVCVLAVRQGTRRVPYWESWDWHNFSYVYSGFSTDATYAQVVINRNGIIYNSVPEVDLPGPQDIDGPDAVWDDGDYYFAASWYVLIYSSPYVAVGPPIGGEVPNLGPAGPVIPYVRFPDGGAGSPDITEPDPETATVEGGSGGGIGPPHAKGLHIWETT